MNEIQEIFNEDIKNKKMAIYSRPINKNSTIKKHKEGEVFVYKIDDDNNKYDNLNWEQFKELKGEERINAFKYLYFEVFKSDALEMAKYMGCKKGNIHDMKYRLKLTEKKEYKRKVKVTKVKEEEKIEKADTKMDKRTVSTFTLNYENSGVNLKERLEGLTKLIDDESHYEVKIELKEYEK